MTLDNAMRNRAPAGYASISIIEVRGLRFTQLLGRTMSYSRWGGSYWYTFWCVQPEGVKETRDNAIFEICTVASFTAKQIRDDIDACLAEVTRRCHDNENWREKPKTSDMIELREYMMEFLEDMEQRYPLAVSS